ncbi:DUF2935 domain-containing protein [Halalkalibacterium halodurans]|uniref:DUF2935 domain-containing protein n=1 Tax=Halalkalibacterium halodurans TaxID=86665 RepID=UPI002E2450DC|nr:DUF2935 domain-containing protein [Halalkalibacterium halodurans]
MQGYEKVALFEHRFWLQVLGDHARFIRDSLSVKEEDHIERAQMFIDIFDRLLEESKQPLTGERLFQLTTSAHEQAGAIRSFKLQLIREHLVNQITIELSPTFLNHMVNEVEEYLRLLPYLENQQIPPKTHPLHHHLVWLLDAAGHAGGLSNSMDLTEKKLKEKSDEFTVRFEQYYIKAVEMAGYLRANVEQFPALQRFNKDVQLEIVLFQTFLDELEEMELSNRLLGTLDALMADHMFREECYYLMKLAEVTELHPPDCDPTKPRTKT